MSNIPNENTITFLQRLTASEWVALITIITFCVSAVFFVENRYAKLTQTQKDIGIQQTQIVQVQTQIISLVEALPKEIREEIVSRSKVNNALNLKQENKVQINNNN